MMKRRVSFSPESPAAIFSKEKSGSGRFKVWVFEIPKPKGGSGFSPASFFRHIGGKVKGVLPPLTHTQRRCSRKVSSASLVRSHSYAETIDSQRAEAIEDCIEFLNSNSSSLQRSNSVSSTSC